MVRALVALAEDLGLVPGNHRVVHNLRNSRSITFVTPGLEDQISSFGFRRHQACTRCIDMHPDKTLTHVKQGKVK